MHRGCFLLTPSEDATSGCTACVFVRALLGPVGQPGLPGAFWCASPFFWLFCPSSLLGPVQTGVALILFFSFLCFPSFLFLFFTRSPVARCLRPFVHSRPGCPLPWHSAFSSAPPSCPPPPAPPPFSPFCALRPGCLWPWRWLASGLGRPQPWRCAASFPLLLFFFPAPPAHSVVCVVPCAACGAVVARLVLLWPAAC